MPGLTPKILDAHFIHAQDDVVGFNNYFQFLETETQLSELRDENVDWFHHVQGSGNETLNVFYNKYRSCIISLYPPLPVNVKNKTREYLQNIYKNLPFEEMKKSEYEHYVQPPGD